MPASILHRYNWNFPPAGTSLLGGRSMVGHMALDHGIGVQIPASQPILQVTINQHIRLGLTCVRRLI